MNVYAPPPGYAARRDPTSVLGRRVVAYLIDLIVPTVLFVILFASSATTVDKSSTLFEGRDICSVLRAEESVSMCFESTDKAYTLTGNEAVLVLAAPLLVGLANWVLLQGVAGASVGKMVTGLRVVDANGDDAGIGRNFARWVLLIVDSLCLVLGLVVAAASTPHRRVGDFVAGTFVVGRLDAGVPIDAAAARRHRLRPPPRRRRSRRRAPVGCRPGRRRRPARRPGCDRRDRCDRRDARRPARAGHHSVRLAGLGAGAATASTAGAGGRDPTRRGQPAAAHRAGVGRDAPGVGVVRPGAQRVAALRRRGAGVAPARLTRATRAAARRDDRAAACSAGLDYAARARAKRPRPWRFASYIASSARRRMSSTDSGTLAGRRDADARADRCDPASDHGRCSASMMSAAMSAGLSVRRRREHDEELVAAEPAGHRVRAVPHW